MNNEPVAWILESDNSPTEFCWDEKELDEVTDVYDMEGWNYKIYPVYTHPHSEESVKAKTLTDEEIYACFHQYFVLGEPKPTHYELEYEDLIDFARAILRKAQEK